MSEPVSPGLPSRSIARPTARQLSVSELWAVVAVALPALAALVAPLSTVDLAYHVRAGSIILDTHALPSPDTFTFTAAGQPWLDQQWAAEVVLAAIYRLGGWGLVAVARAGLVALISWLVYRGCRAQGAGRRVSAWLTLAGFAVALVALAMRPQLLGMVLFATVVAILAVRQRHARLVWAIPFLVAAWANVHGSFLLGPAAVAVAWLEDRVAGRPQSDRLLVVALASLVATLVNPYGLAVWAYAGALATNPQVRQLVTEWQATNPLSFAGAVFYASIVGMAALLWLTARRDRDGGVPFIRRSWPTLVWLVGLALFGAFAERGVAWWAIAAPVAMAGFLAPWTREVLALSPRPTWFASAVAAGVLLAIAFLLPSWRAGDSLYGPSGVLAGAPRVLTDAVRTSAGPTDRIWNAQGWGSWLEFAVPGTPVAVDSRIELIPADAWQDHLSLSRADPDWASILDRRGVTIVVASAREQAALISLLRASSTWRVLVDDSDGAVFVRTNRAGGGG